MSDYSELKRLAEAATPGPWVIDEARQIFAPSAGEYVAVTEIEDFDPIPFKQGAMDASFIAAANPTAVLALIAENEALRKDAERYRFLRRTDCWQDLDNDDTYDGQLPTISFSLWIIGARDDAENRSGEMLDRSIDYFMSKEPKAE